MMSKKAMEKVSSSGTAMEKGSSSGTMAFPQGLRVLLVENDPTCLMIIEGMLKTSKYHVLAVTCGIDALDVLRETNGGFDIVITIVHMPGMNGFELLHHIRREFDHLPVLMMSMDDKLNVVTRSLDNGACFFLAKPITMNDVQNIWQHVLRIRMKHSEEAKALTGSDRESKVLYDYMNHEENSNKQEGKKKNKKRRKESSDVEDESNKDSSTNNKARVIWNDDLCRKFLETINTLGIDASPMKIQKHMDIPGLTREIVASHLQKHRIFLSELEEATRSKKPRLNEPQDNIHLASRPQINPSFPGYSPFAPTPQEGNDWGLNASNSIPAVCPANSPNREVSSSNFLAQPRYGQSIPMGNQRNQQPLCGNSSSLSQQSDPKNLTQSWLGNPSSHNHQIKLQQPLLGKSLSINQRNYLTDLPKSRLGNSPSQNRRSFASTPTPRTKLPSVRSGGPLHRDSPAGSSPSLNQQPAKGHPTPRTELPGVRIGEPLRRDSPAGSSPSLNQQPAKGQPTPRTELPCVRIGEPLRHDSPAGSSPSLNQQPAKGHPTQRTKLPSVRSGGPLHRDSPAGRSPSINQQPAKGYPTPRTELPCVRIGEPLLRDSPAGCSPSLNQQPSKGRPTPRMELPSVRIGEPLCCDSPAGGSPSLNQLGFAGNPTPITELPGVKIAEPLRCDSPAGGLDKCKAPTHCESSACLDKGKAPMFSESSAIFSKGKDEVQMLHQQPQARSGYQEDRTLAGNFDVTNLDIQNILVGSVDTFNRVPNFNSTNNFSGIQVTSSRGLAELSQTGPVGSESLNDIDDNYDLIDKFCGNVPDERVSPSVPEFNRMSSGSAIQGVVSSSEFASANQFPETFTNVAVQCQQSEPGNQFSETFINVPVRQEQPSIPNQFQPTFTDAVTMQNQPPHGNQFLETFTNASKFQPMFTNLVMQQPANQFPETFTEVAMQEDQPQPASAFLETFTNSARQQEQPPELQTINDGWLKILSSTFTDENILLTEPNNEDGLATISNQADQPEIQMEGVQLLKDPNFSITEYQMDDILRAP